MVLEIQRRMHRMWDDPTLTRELYRAMERVEALGVQYPPGHKEMVAGRYTPENVPYPYIIMQIAQARIRKHFLYPDLFRQSGSLLDYGCGTGEAIRQLIRDGYPATKILGFDISDASLSLGYDLYLDQEVMEKRIIVFPAFPCPRERFDRVYSGSVIHVLGDKQEFLTYLRNSYRTLRQGGLFFGSTLGLDDGADRRPEKGPPRLMQQRELEAALAIIGFDGIRIIRDDRSELGKAERGFCLFQFSAQKNA